ncbi:protein of unknown function [Pararobbsia alpina]|uniref:hypothetical protein n=1 Tax=Pararobbsia alpina TaxID=621374 RepID=UPI0039A62650
MVLLCGPKNSRYTYTGSRCPHTDLALESDALTLGDAIAQYERHFGVRISIHIDAEDAEEKFGDKYFRYIDEAGDEDILVDIHVFRGDEELCPKQNLDFALEDADIVELGPLLC